MLGVITLLGCLSTTGQALIRPGNNHRDSIGCGKISPVSPGTTSLQHLEVEGLRRSYRIHVPKSYDTNTAMPLILSHHGWTCSAQDDEIDSGLSEQSEKNGFIVAYLNGWDDNPNSHPTWSTWRSWNGAGTINSTTKAPGCLAWGGKSEYCYTSCKHRDTKEWKGCDKLGCDWTTCVSSEAFNIAVLDHIESEMCVDVTREYATGQSNGAIYTFWIGATLSRRLAAIAPISGSYMNGYITAPAVPLPVMDVTGTQDTIVPINDTTYGKGPVSSEGWIYSLMSDIFAAWEPANGCTDKDVSAHFPTSFDGTYELYCWGKRCGENGSYPVIRCAWNGGHNYFGNKGSTNGPLVWGFLSQFSRETHLGQGVTVDNVGTTGGYRGDFGITVISQQKEFVTSTSKLRNISWTGEYYGNPVNGCREGESILNFTDGHVNATTCAPTIPPGGCTVGGYRPDDNGCPASTYSATFTTCLGISANKSKGVGEEFHCVLACDRTKSKTAEDPEANSKCPEGASCMPGHLRYGHVGICVYQT